VILVAGGTGRLGTLIVRALVDRGFEVRVLTRDLERVGPTSAGVEVVIGDVRNRTSLDQAVAGADFVISAVHGFEGPRGISPATVDRDGNVNLIDAAKSVGADFVLLSTVGASMDSPMELFRMKYAAERYAAASGVPTTIVRATAFLELWIELLRKTAGRSGRPLVFGRGDNAINFVSVTDVAAVVVLAVTDSATRSTTLEIGGPADLTFNELAQKVIAGGGATVTPRHIPTAALKLMANTVGRVKPQLGRQARAAIIMDRDDFTFDGASIHRAYPGLPCTALGALLPIETRVEHSDYVGPGVSESDRA
jgi:uncharacterized protein YbjT (DUF2867 family)